MIRKTAIAACIVLGCAAAIGCAKSANGNDTGATTTNQTTVSAQRVGSVDRGKLVFQNNCSTCHGTTGREGGVGPSLRDERARKNDDATIAWIKHPAPPMPKLYPSPLSEGEVEDVAAYVQSL